MLADCGRLVAQDAFVCFSGIVAAPAHLRRGLFLAITVLAVNVLGYGLRDMVDPRLRKQT